MSRKNLRSFQDIQEFKIFLRSWQDIDDVKRWLQTTRTFLLEFSNVLCLLELDSIFNHDHNVTVVFAQANSIHFFVGFSIEKVIDLTEFNYYLKNISKLRDKRSRRFPESIIKYRYYNRVADI